MKTILKINKIVLVVLLIGFSFISCDLNEEAPDLAPDSIFASEASTEAALNGAFSGMANYQLYGADFHHLTDFMSGLFTSGRAPDRRDIVALAPTPSQNYPTAVWAQSYTSIVRSNDIIAGIDENTDNNNLKNFLGIAYFLRAHNYFNLVRLYGGVPIRTEPTTQDKIHEPRASVQDVYDLIISDAKKAENLMYDIGLQLPGRPAKYAANMLMAKAYMTLAGNDNASPYWQEAYNEAIKVYGKYSLVSDYISLWDNVSSANNTSESIFEIQYNEENSNSLTRLFTAGGAYPGPGWNRIRPNPETIDMHMAKYPNDPRIEGTFLTSYVNINNGSTVKVYPERGNRNGFVNSFSYIYKYFVKDVTMTSFTTNYNYVPYRYADLLLMLAEIENELNGPTGAYQYVNEVLLRARNSGNGSAEPADWSGLTQQSFRDAIMREYHYELLGEGHDFFISRRRGYDFFKANYIDIHNARNDQNFDVVYPDDSKAMLVPIPADEINVNEKISASDQNPGY